MKRGAVTRVVATPVTSGRAATVTAAVLLMVATVIPLRAAAADATNTKVQLCQACHGPAGNPTDPAIPALAGQPKQFITTQLVMYREGRRINDVMSAIAKDMPNPDINEYGTYFSAQKRTVITAPDLPADKLAAGAAVTQRFNCVQCHGPTLMGLQHIPRIAGQQADYLRAQMIGFKAGTRFDMDGNMTAAAQPLTPADIELLSVYLSSRP